MFFYKAFGDLSTCRPPDGPIPWRDCMAYADRKGLTSDVADVLWTVIKKMDSAERNWQIENTKGSAGDG